MNLLEPWVLLRLLAGAVVVFLFAYGAWTSLRVVTHFDVARASEGQLALERQVELAATFVRFATTVQVGCLALTVLAANRLSHVVRGAMCAYGVFQANEWGFRALLLTGLVAVGAGILSQLYAFDRRVRGLELVRPLAVATLVLAPFAVLDFVGTSVFLMRLDLSVVASCCSVQLDPVSSAANTYASGPRQLVAIGAPVAIALSVVVGLLAARRPRASSVACAGALSLMALPLAIGAAVLEVAPHAFEIPQHVCPFCLLRGDALYLGYPLFGALLLAIIWGAGAAVSGLLCRGPAARAAFESFAAGRLRRNVVAWSITLVVGMAPVVRYAIVSGGSSLFR